MALSHCSVHSQCNSLHHLLSASADAPTDASQVVNSFVKRQESFLCTCIAHFPTVQHSALSSRFSPLAHTNPNAHSTPRTSAIIFLSGMTLANYSASERCFFPLVSHHYDGSLRHPRDLSNDVVELHSNNCRTELVVMVSSFVIHCIPIDRLNGTNLLIVARP